MIILKGYHLHIKHSRKGEFDAIALRDFDTETTEFYPLALAKRNYVVGLSNFTYWQQGEEIPCRRSLCTFIVL